MTDSVCAVVVTYRATHAELTACLDAVRPQVSTVLVVDNGSAGVDALVEFDVLLASASNVGLAAAQNAGADWARRNGHTHVLFLDQDSIAAPGMVSALLAALDGRHGQRVAAVGPQFRDPRDERDAPFVEIRFPRSRRLNGSRSSDGSDVVVADFLIGSGLLVPLAVLDEVGPMDAGMFIDNVDLDWSFRARAAGYVLLGVFGARMEHRLGAGRRVVGRWHIVVHPPRRLYFMTRNRILLYRRASTPRVWIAQDLPRLGLKVVTMTVLVGPRLRNARYLMRGLLDGVRGRDGACPLESP